MKTMRDTECGKPTQTSGKIKSGTLAGLQNDGKPHDKKYQSVYKIDHRPVELEEFRECNHAKRIVAYGSGEASSSNMNILILQDKIKGQIFAQKGGDEVAKAWSGQ